LEDRIKLNENIVRKNIPNCFVVNEVIFSVYFGIYTNGVAFYSESLVVQLYLFIKDSKTALDRSQSVS